MARDASHSGELVLKRCFNHSGREAAARCPHCGAVLLPRVRD